MFLELPQPLPRIRGIRDVGRHAHAPCDAIFPITTERVPPLRQATFSGVNLLATTNQADHRAEPRVTRHGLQEVPRLRLGEADRLVARFSDRPIRRPATLCLIHNDNPFGG